MADFDKSKFDPKAAAEARKQEMDQMTQKLEAGVKDVFQGENYKAYLDFCAKMPRYSINNQILIMMQKPDATMCQSFTGWKEMGRFVKKGEKGIRVMAPAPYKMEREQDKASLDTIRRAASDLIVKIDEKIAELTQGQEKNQFAEIDQWIAAHGDELPFDSPEANQPAGFIEITPPVDMSEFKADKPFEITVPEAKEPTNDEADKAPDSKQDEKEKSEKKKSVKKQLSDKKEKAAKTAKPKKVDTKNLGEAI